MNQDSQKVKVSTEYNTLRQRLLKYIDVEVLDNEDENYTDEQSSEFENEQYSNFVYKVKHVDTNQQWIVFDDNYTSGPISKSIKSILGKPSVTTYINIVDGRNITVVIDWNKFTENFSQIMVQPLLSTNDEDLVGFINEYIDNEKYDPKNIFDKETVSLVDLYAYLYNTYKKKTVLYFKEYDVYSNRNDDEYMTCDDNSKVRVSFLHPFGEPPLVSVGFFSGIIVNKRILKKHCSVDIPLRAVYSTDSLPFEPASALQVDEKVRKVQEYIDTYELYCAYKGTGLIPGFFGPRQVYMNGRVINDCGALYFVDPEHFNGLWKTVGITGSTGISDSIEAPDTYSERELMSLTKYEIFYELTKKQWFIGTRDNTASIQFRKDAFEKLQLDPVKKDIIRKICSANTVSSNIDFIDGKGGGNIFLLHGTPGTGKTLTAEAISELLEKPLYKVNISEYDGLQELENGVEEALRYAERWDATLLIDEADVALERRDSNNIERNAIVAVFLRLIEYYTGTMFLTSNRASEFDEAFKSRITFAVHYKKPSNYVRATIWTNILENIRNDLTNNDISELAQHDINGRQIKNIISTASYMSDDGTVLKENVSLVLEQTLEFENFIGLENKDD